MSLAIRTFPYPDNSLPAGPSTPAVPLTNPLTLSISLKGASYLLVHPTPLSTSAPNERQWTIINALVQSDPFPARGENGRVRIWLKVGAGKAGEQGGENEGILDKLLAAGMIHDTGIKSEQGMIRYPLVELLVSVPEMCNACASCGLFENSKEGEQRFKRCARCKLVYYCSAFCQAKDWKASHRPECLDLPHDDNGSIEEARRKGLLRLFGRAGVVESGGPRSKMD